MQEGESRSDLNELVPHQNDQRFSGGLTDCCKKFGDEKQEVILEQAQELYASDESRKLHFYYCLFLLCTMVCLTTSLSVSRPPPPP